MLATDSILSSHKTPHAWGSVTERYNAVGRKGNWDLAWRNVVWGIRTCATVWLGRNASAELRDQRIEKATFHMR